MCAISRHLWFPCSPQGSTGSEDLKSARDEVKMEKGIFHAARPGSTTGPYCRSEGKLIRTKERSRVSHALAQISLRANLLFRIFHCVVTNLRIRVFIMIQLTLVCLCVSNKVFNFKIF